jgi:hypothetical protein
MYRILGIIFRANRLASEVEEGCLASKGRDGKGQIGLGSVGVLEGIPEGSARAEERAANLVPVTLGVLDRGNSITRLGSNCKAQLAF